jgi:SepF-like predicted cell division protein (DUF552 family)
LSVKVAVIKTTKDMQNMSVQIVAGHAVKIPPKLLYAANAATHVLMMGV